MTGDDGRQPVRTIFLGTGNFAVPVVEALLNDERINLLGVITVPLRDPSQDPSTDVPVAQWALRRRVGAFRPIHLRDQQAIDGVGVGSPELLVLADYGQIVPSALLTLPRYGALNLHPSLLPRHRGAAPIQATIMSGDMETGVSLIKMDAGVDTGPIVAQKAMALNRDETAPQLQAVLSGLAAELLIDTLGPWLAGDIEPVDQSAEGATYTRPLRREDGRLDVSAGIDYLDRQMRAYQPWPGAFVETDAGRVIIWDARPLDAGASRSAGMIMRLPANRVALSTRDGLLELVEVQPAGGRRMTGSELLRGRPQLAGSRVELPAPDEDD